MQAYHKYVEEGASQGRRPDLLKGGLAQSFRKEAGGLVSKSPYERMLADPRILGDKDFIVNELRMGSRRHRISKVRSRIGRRLVNDLGIPLTKVARQLGVSTSGISKMLQRKECSQES